MTRIRASDYDHKRRLILQQAAALFARQGFESTTMAEVAQACGSSKSHLYHYFSHKEDLLFELVREHISAQDLELSAIVDGPETAEVRFEKFVAAFVGHSADSRNEHLVLMNEIKFLKTPQRQEVRALERRLVALLVALLREINPELMHGGAPRPPYAMLLFGMIIWTFTWYQKSGPIPPRELAVKISGLFMDGFKGSLPRVDSAPSAPG